jgi:hypothetical protein
MEIRQHSPIDEDKAALSHRWRQGSTLPYLFMANVVLTFIARVANKTYSTDITWNIYV